MSNQDPSKYFWMGAGAVLAGMAADRLFSHMSLANLTRMAYAVREIRHAFGGGAPQPVVLNPNGSVPDDEDLPPSYRQQNGIVAEPPPSVASSQISDVYMPPGEVVPLSEEEDALVEAQSILSSLTDGPAIDVNWQYA